MMWFVVLITVILIGMALIAMSNVLFFIRLNRVPLVEESPSVSVLIPARDEAGVLNQTLRCLQAQMYPSFEVIVLDDDSKDGTAGIVNAFSQKDSRFKVVAGEPLPSGWTGKNWACYQLSRLARGEYFVFADADVYWEPEALARVVASMVRTRADGLAVWPAQITKSWGERLVIPLMAMTVLGYLPSLFVHHLPFDSMVAAIGQCMEFRRSAYEEIGGHELVKDRVLDDVLLMRRIKAKGLRFRMVDASGLISCRMYENWAAVRNGFAKNILAGHGDSVAFLLFSAVFHWSVFLLPWLWLAVGWTGIGPAGWPVWPLVLISLGVGMRALTASTSGQRPGDALLLPVSILMMTWIAGQSVWWHYHYGGPYWKGRVILRSPSNSSRPRGENSHE